MALVRGEEQVCRVVQVPIIAQEDERRLSRERERLLHERNSHIARIKGLLALHGVRDYRLVVGVWKERLDAIRTANGHALPARAKTEIERECRRLWLAKEMLAEVEREIEQMIERDSAAAGKLIRVRGIGPTFASVLTHEVFYRSSAGRSAATWGWSRSRGRVAASGATRASPGRATRERGDVPSSWRGCGCGISQAARSRAGTAPVSAP